MNKLLLVTIATVLMAPGYVLASDDHGDKAGGGCFSCFRTKQKATKEAKVDEVELQQEAIPAKQSKEDSLASEKPEKSKKKKVKTVMIEDPQLKDEKKTLSLSEAEDDTAENQEADEKIKKKSKREKIKREDVGEEKDGTSRTETDKPAQKSEVKEEVKVEKAPTKDKPVEVNVNKKERKTNHVRQKSSASKQSNESDKKEGDK